MKIWPHTGRSLILRQNWYEKKKALSENKKFVALALIKTDKIPKADHF